MSEAPRSRPGTVERGDALDLTDEERKEKAEKRVKARMRELLTTLFRKYASEMGDLRLAVESSEQRFEGLEGELSGRLNRVEDVLSRGQRNVQGGRLKLTIL